MQSYMHVPRHCSCHLPQQHSHTSVPVPQDCKERVRIHTGLRNLSTSAINDSRQNRPPNRQGSPQRTPSRDDASQDTDDVPPQQGGKRAPRASQAQRQLFGALDSLRTGNVTEQGFGNSTGSSKDNKSRQQPQKGKQTGRRRSPAETGPEDVIVLAPPPKNPKPTQATKPAASATATGAAIAATAVVAAGAAVLNAERGVEEVDGNDGAQVWRDRLAQVGWEYDEDEDEEEDEDEAFEDEEDMGDLDEGEELPDLVEVVPYGTWFAGEGEQPPETDEQQELRRWYTDKEGYLPPTQWGNIKVAEVSRKGRGLVATQKLNIGDLVMVSRPIALMEYNTEGDKSEEGPENEELADKLMTSALLTAAQRNWLDTLLQDKRPDQRSSTDGASSGNKGARHLRLPTEEDVQVLQQDPGPTYRLPSQDAEGKARLYQLVNLNCQGEEFKEVAASSLRDEAAPGWLGLWPDAALINHSCAPSATCWVLGDRLVVRVTEEIEAGQEVTLSYLGALLTSPLATRRAELKDKWGFHCTCVRCKAEERAAPSGSELSTQVQEIYQWCTELNEVLTDALEEEDMKEVAEIKQELEERRQDFEAGLRAAKVSSKARRWLQASVYDLYDMLSLCADEQSGSGSNSGSSQAGGREKVGKLLGKKGAVDDGLLDTENLAVCARILESIGRGSDAQAYLAAEYMVRAGVRFGVQHQEAQEAQKMCRQAFMARFGPISPSMMDQLVTARLDD